LLTAPLGHGELASHGLLMAFSFLRFSVNLFLFRVSPKETFILRTE